VPTKDNIKAFIETVDTFEKENSNKIIGVHCTHGYNRTGFLICAYLVEKNICNLGQALNEFARCRPHGIYKQSYIDQLYKLYPQVLILFIIKNLINYLI